jgi:Protein of unknown function (DUF2569)
LRPRPDSVSGLGGWLVLPIIGLFLTCLSSIALIFLDILPFWNSWTALTSPGSAAYHALMGAYVGFRSFVDIALLVAPIFLLALLFMKKRVLPQIIVYFYIFVLFVMLLDFVALVTFLERWLSDRGFAEEASTLVSQGMVRTITQGIAVCGIWIPYFLYSKRVANTFQQRPRRLPDPSVRKRAGGQVTAAA